MFAIFPFNDKNMEFYMNRNRVWYSKDFCIQTSSFILFFRRLNLVNSSFGEYNIFSRVLMWHLFNFFFSAFIRIYHSMSEIYHTKSDRVDFLSFSLSWFRSANSTKHPFTPYTWRALLGSYDDFKTFHRFSRSNESLLIQIGIQFPFFIAFI